MTEIKNKDSLKYRLCLNTVYSQSMEEMEHQLINPKFFKLSK